MTEKVQLWRVEHGPEYEPAPFFLALIESGKVEDWSWHNDTCPHFATREKRDGRVLEVYMEAARPEDREAPEVARYSFYWGDDDGSDETPFFCTNDDAEAEGVFEKFFAGEELPEGGVRWWESEKDFDQECRDRGHDPCATHAPGCDGFCDHLADHTNACLAEGSEHQMMLVEEQERAERPAACRRGQCMCPTH